jgi:hypothetical protein
MHFGMSGWMKFSNDESAYYRPKKATPGDDAEEWPPRFWKFNLELEGSPKCQVAFVDPRRLARIRLIDVAKEEMRQTSPLKENGTCDCDSRRSDILFRGTGINLAQCH